MSGSAAVDIDTRSGVVTSFSKFYRRRPFQRREPYTNEVEVARDALIGKLADRFGTGIYTQSDNLLSYNSYPIEDVATYIPTWSISTNKLSGDGSRQASLILIMHPVTRAIIMASDMGGPLSGSTPEPMLNVGQSSWRFAGTKGKLTSKDTRESVSGSLRVLKSDKAVMVGLYSAETNTFFVGEERYAPSEELAVAMR